MDEPDEPGLLRSRWFPIVLHDPLVFRVIVLFSASHYAIRSNQGSQYAVTILSLKQEALAAINAAISCVKGRASDYVVASIAKMASYEAIFGSEDQYHAHMDGLTKMLEMRGGLSALGLGGFLARLLLFIDSNSAFLLRTRLRLGEFSFPRRPPIAPNPSRFVGCS